MKKGLFLLIVVTVLATILLTSCYKMDYDFDIASCEVDEDCIRQPSCCDCSLGTYINKQYFKEVKCSEQCECLAEPSVGMCIEGTCKGIPLDQEFCDETHRLGETWEEDGKPCTCLLDNVIDCGTTEQKINKQEAETAISTYYDTVDYSCNVNSDCEIKDIHNCCGYFPKCTNVNFEVQPDSVQEWCEISEMSAVCGFPTINSCECQEGTCVGII